MQSNLNAGKFVRPLHRSCTPKESTKVTNVMVVYQDAHTRRWASSFYPAKLNGCEVVKCTWWNLNDLSEPGVLAGAVSTAIRADVIVVAVLTGTGLPLPFYVWADSWLPHRKLTEGKLIALVGLAKERKQKDAGGRTYLREMARHGNLNLVEKEYRLPGKPSVVAAERNGRRFQQFAFRQDPGNVCPAPTSFLNY